MDKSEVDLREVIGADVPLRFKGRTNGGEYAGPCPFCGGTDRFLVWPDADDGGRFWCRQCQRSGDVITYVRLRDGSSFREACDRLQLGNFHASNQRPQLKTTQHRFEASGKLTKASLTDPGWQQLADPFVIHAHETLYAKAGRAELGSLYDRGMTDDIIRAYKLGASLNSVDHCWGNTPVTVHSGITIPWYFRNTIWRINVRRPQGSSPKYMQVRGSAEGLYNADAIRYGCKALLMEGELNVLSMLIGAREVLEQHQVVPVGTGSASWARLPLWLAKIGMASKVLLCFDADKDGDNAAEWWGTRLGRRAVKMEAMPHDANDMLRLGYDLNQHVAEALKELE